MLEDPALRARPRRLPDRERLLTEVTRAQEQERERIAADIHDDPIQKLSAASMRLYLLAEDHPELADDERLARIIDTVDMAIASLRRLMFDLRPVSFEAEGLGVALRAHVEHLAGDELAPELTLECDLDGEPTEAVRVTMFRIVQEALSNIARHAGASHIVVRLNEVPDGYLGRVTDDGAGFVPDPSEEIRPGHIGMTLMRERAAQAGGWLRVESAAGRGTVVEFFLPDAGPGERSLGRNHEAAFG